jgi:hypothetical protein
MPVCPACLSSCTLGIDLGEALGTHLRGIRHLDFEPFSETIIKLKHWECESCNHAFREIHSKSRDILSNYYRSKEYSLHSEEKKVEARGEGKPSEHRSIIQANYISSMQILCNLPPSYLDIGCFDGNLLGALASKSDSVRIGYDLVRRPNFERISRNSLFIEDFDVERVLELSGGKVSGVILSHSLIYERYLDVLIEKIRNVLSPSGFIYVECPDTVLRPSNLMLVDQYHYFSKNSLSALFARHGFKVNFDQTVHHNGDLVAVAYQESCPLSELLEYPVVANRNARLINRPDRTKRLQVVQTCLQRRALQGDLAVLGTTYSSSFVMQVIGEGVGEVFDEFRMGSYFYGKQVSQLEKPASNILVLPLGANSLTAHTRLRRLLPNCELIPLTI